MLIAGTEEGNIYFVRPHPHIVKFQKPLLPVILYVSQSYVWELHLRETIRMIYSGGSGIIQGHKHTQWYHQTADHLDTSPPTCADGGACQFHKFCGRASHAQC